MPLEEMTRRANQVAGVSVQVVGTQTSYPFRKELPAELFWEQQVWWAENPRMNINVKLMIDNDWLMLKFNINMAAIWLSV